MSLYIWIYLAGLPFAVSRAIFVALAPKAFHVGELYEGAKEAGFSNKTSLAITAVFLAVMSFAWPVILVAALFGIVIGLIGLLWKAVAK